MTLKLFRKGDLTILAGWTIMGFITSGFGAAILWSLIAPIYLVVLVTKLVMRLIPSKRERASLRLMWPAPAIFLAMLPLYVYRFNTARDAGNQVVRTVEKYREIHGVYPSNEEVLGLDLRILQSHRLFYDGKDGKPILFYASPLIIFDTYDFDFDRKEWTYRPD